MILGVDHVAVSVSGLERGEEIFNASGFSTRFRERRVPNPPAKKPFLASYEPFHDLAYCPAKKGVAVELTRHAPAATGLPGPYQPVFGASLSGGTGVDDPNGDELSELLGRKVMRGGHDSLGSQYWHYGGEEQSLETVALHVSRLESSAAFWRALGFKSEGRTLRFRSMFPHWTLTLALVPSRRAVGDTLDARGFPCLALISTDLRTDAARALDAGGTRPTEPFEMVIAQKRIEVILLQGPDGEPVEIIEIKKKQEDFA